MTLEAGVGKSVVWGDSSNVRRQGGLKSAEAVSLGGSFALVGASLVMLDAGLDLPVLYLARISLFVSLAVFVGSVVSFRWSSAEPDRKHYFGLPSKIGFGAGAEPTQLCFSGLG